MIEWLSQYSGYAVLFLFFIAFAGIWVWTYKPSNRARLEDYRDIPLRETE